jgi:hypothetical protein
MDRPTIDRRRALGVMLGVVALGASPFRGARALTSTRAVVHPEPRPGITAAKVLPAERVKRRARAAYQAAREIPEVLDGLYCHCDCASRDGLRSLFACFETEMPNGCGVCTGEAVLARKLHRKRSTLAEIRAAVDEKYG